jgi:sulfur carrier protein
MAHLGVGSDAVAIILNGDSRDIPAGSTITSLLTSLELDPRLVVVERNREILRDRDAYGHIELAGGDTIEIVHFVGGG